MPIYGGKKMSLNTLEEHAPKPEWIKDFFEKQDEFFQDNSLGRNQLQIFKRFLSDSSLASKSKVTYFAQRLTKIGWETEQVWGLILIELAYNNPQIKWYIVNLRINVDYKREQVESELLSIGQSEKMARAIVSAFKRLSATPLGTIINFGSVSETGTGRKKEMVLYRNKSSLSDIRVILYSLYKFAEACEGYYQFTLSRLYDYSADSAGISPTMIFGFERDEMTVFLNAMSVKYPEFIHFTSIHDLEKISLREDKTSSDVLELFN
jgi:phosphoadenosine phosphosulfate reductase